MKRFLWLACLCSASTFAIACGDDDSSGDASEDGGVLTLDEVTDRLGDVDDTLTDVQGDLVDLGSRADDLEGSVDDLNGSVDDLDGRLADLENPEIVSCSENEICIPDGVSLVSAGIEDLVARLCELEINCCSADELNYKFGPGIATVAECTETFVDLINNGLSPDFLETNGHIIRYVIEMAQALNDTRTRLQLDQDAVDACLEFLEDHECPQYAEGGEFVPEHCTEGVPEQEDDPCEPMNMLTGLQEEGELCGIHDFFNECADGFVCRYGTGYGDEGICGAVAEAGERCTHDDDCDSWQTELFCNKTTGECQERGDAGDDCGYVDPTFASTDGLLNPSMDESWHQRPPAMAIECKRGFWCDPVARECVPFCSDGALCYPGEGNWACPEGLTCNITETPRLYTNASWHFGVCRGALAVDAPCTLASECASNRCGLGADGYVCFPAQKAEGEACTLTVAGMGQLDSECETGFCAATTTSTTAGACGTRCNGQAECPDTHFCEADMYINPDYGDDVYACDLKRAIDAPCDGDYDLADPQGERTNYECASGFCDPLTDTCEAKVAAGGACTTHAACPATQYCNSVLCTDFVPTDGDCANNNYFCGPGNYCWLNTAVYDCRPYGGVGDTCDALGNQCNLYNDGLRCTTMGVAASQCHVPGAFPAGATCSVQWAGPDGTLYQYDTICADGACNTIDYTCIVPVAAGEPCDAAVPTLSRCERGTYCKYPLDGDTTEGLCTAQNTVGQACDPRFNHSDCLNNHACSLRNDAFVCGSGAIPEETAYCDGE
jgi:hypothetical protein